MFRYICKTLFVPFTFFILSVAYIPLAVYNIYTDNSSVSVRSIGLLQGDVQSKFTPWGSRGREIESRHSDQNKSLIFLVISRKSGLFLF